MSVYQPNPKAEPIIHAAIALLNAEGAKVATARIAKAASVSNGGLFNHFPTKQAIFDEVFLYTKHAMITALGAKNDLDDAMYFRTLWSRYVDWGQTHRDWHQAMSLIFYANLASEGAKARVDGWLAPYIDEFGRRLGMGHYRFTDPIAWAQLFLAALDHAIAKNFTDAEQERLYDVLWFGNLNPNSKG